MVIIGASVLGYYCIINWKCKLIYNLLFSFCNCLNSFLLISINKISDRLFTFIVILFVFQCSRKTILGIDVQIGHSETHFFLLTGNLFLLLDHAYLIYYIEYNQRIYSHYFLIAWDKFDPTWRLHSGRLPGATRIGAWVPRRIIELTTLQT